MRLRGLIILGAVLAHCHPLPAESGVESRSIPAGNIPVLIRSGLIGDSGVSAGDVSGTKSNVTAIIEGTQPLEGITLDSAISSWGDIGLTYTNAARLNSVVIISNNSVWTGWTATGSLKTNGSILLLEGEYLQSPVQVNGISSYSISENSDQNGTSTSAILLVGTNQVYFPYTGTNAFVKITGGSTLPGCAAGVYISSAVITGYGDTEEASRVKIVSGLKIIDPPSEAADVVNKQYTDAGDAGSMNYANNQIATYAADDTKTVRGAQLRLNQSWTATTGNGQDWILSCGEISGSGQLVGTSNYFALAQNDYPLLTFSADATGLYINSFTVTTVDSTNKTVTLNIATNGVVGQPYAEWTKNLMVGEWTRVLTYSTNTYPTASGSNYVLRFTAPTGSGGYFRTMQPAGQSRITVSANVFDLGSNHVANVSYIAFTNGWKVVCSTNGLQFVAP